MASAVAKMTDRQLCDLTLEQNQYILPWRYRRFSRQQQDARKEIQRRANGQRRTLSFPLVPESLQLDELSEIDISRLAISPNVYRSLAQREQVRRLEKKLQGVRNTSNQAITPPIKQQTRQEPNSQTINSEYLEYGETSSQVTQRAQLHTHSSTVTDISSARKVPLVFVKDGQDSRNDDPHNFTGGDKSDWRNNK